MTNFHTHQDPVGTNVGQYVDLRRNEYCIMFHNYIHNSPLYKGHECVPANFDALPRLFTLKDLLNNQ